ncbi:MAG: hypothetical protein EA424_12930 [Planctomycetaceae bacterium]|nr:MAG: hypothetical protein EA424_12930 [Planctomycetaceae bacterium]
MAAERAIVPLEFSGVLPIVIPSGKTSSRRTVVSSDEMTKTEPSKVDLAELDVPKLDVPEISELESESIAVLTPEPSAFEPQGEPKRSALPPLPPLRHHGMEALPTSDHHDQADLALASLQMSEPTPAVRHIAADVEHASSEGTAQGMLADDADVSAPLRRLRSNDVESPAPAILRDRSVISDSPLDPAPVAELRPINDASRLELGLKSQRIETVIHQLFPGSRIECQREPARLIVRGYAQNERQAIDIISTIRRSQLIPVVDLIEIRAQGRRIQMP